VVAAVVRRRGRGQSDIVDLLTAVCATTVGVVIEANERRFHRRQIFADPLESRKVNGPIEYPADGGGKRGRRVAHRRRSVVAPNPAVVPRTGPVRTGDLAAAS
jgi:hypothetical protein